MFSAYWESLDVIDNVCMHAGPVNCLSCLALHLLHPQVYTMEVSKGPVKELGRVQTQSPFRRIPALLDILSQVPQKS